MFFSSIFVVGKARLLRFLVTHKVIYRDRKRRKAGAAKAHGLRPAVPSQEGARGAPSDHRVVHVVLGTDAFHVAIQAAVDHGDGAKIPPPRPHLVLRTPAVLGHLQENERGRQGGREGGREVVRKKETGAGLAWVGVKEKPTTRTNSAPLTIEHTEDPSQALSRGQPLGPSQALHSVNRSRADPAGMGVDQVDRIGAALVA